MTAPVAGSQEWLDLVVEDVIDPDQPIVDPHHHLWRPGQGLPYTIDELHADVADGHCIEHTVFIECHSSYRRDGPEEQRSLGETEFVAEVAAADPSGLIAGIVAHVDLCRADLDDLLDMHEAAGGGLLRGIRDALARSDGTPELTIPGRAVPGLATNPDFVRGVARLGERDLTYDSWHYHFQNHEFLALARAVPSTTMVIDHFGTPIGVGAHALRSDEIFEQWSADVAEIASCPNVVAKLGGMAMIDNGYGWDRAERPPTSDEFVAAQGRYYRHMIDCFGPQRCMFESNFPIDRYSLSYRTLWNAFKKIAAEHTPADREAMFSATARRVYRID